MPQKNECGSDIRGNCTLASIASVSLRYHHCEILSGHNGHICGKQDEDCCIPDAVEYRNPSLHLYTEGNLRSSAHQHL